MRGGKAILDHLLPKRQRLTRGHHAAMPYADIPAFGTKLAEINTVAAKALMFTILTFARTSETLRMTLMRSASPTRFCEIQPAT